MAISEDDVAVGESLIGALRRTENGSGGGGGVGGGHAQGEASGHVVEGDFNSGAFGLDVGGAVPISVVVEEGDEMGVLSIVVAILPLENVRVVLAEKCRGSPI